jgi:thymidylate synthase (FAD)
VTLISAKLIAVTQPTIETRVPNAEALVAYCARVSSPDNQDNHDTSEKLLAYCVRNKHWSIFEMVNAVVEIEAPRDITRQLIRHPTIKVQEFSQRYSDQLQFTNRKARSQDFKNRQNSIDDLDIDTKDAFEKECEWFALEAEKVYRYWTEKVGVAKECARVFLPEGLTMSRLYANGNLRSWIHYLEVREGNGTQLEHTQLANKIREALLPAFPLTLGMT